MHMNNLTKCTIVFGGLEGPLRFNAAAPDKSYASSVNDMHGSVLKI